MTQKEINQLLAENAKLREMNAVLEKLVDVDNRVIETLKKKINLAIDMLKLPEEDEKDECIEDKS